MKPRFLSLLLAGAALALTACGGSSHAPTSTVITIGAAAAPTTSTTTAAASPPAQRKTTSRKPASVPVSQPTVTATTPNAGIPRSAHVSGPTPNICLKAVGLLTPHATQTSTWEAYDPSTKAPVFVDGPYKNKGQARASAKSLVGVESASPGGLYVVSANLASHLGFKVNATAKCLSGSSGHGTLHF